METPLGYSSQCDDAPRTMSLFCHVPHILCGSEIVSLQEMNIAVQIRSRGATMFPVAVVLRFHGCIPASVA